jgi:hypothetical protein
MTDVNTSACEQLNAWVKRFSHILSNMNKAHFRVTLLLIAHLRNCYHSDISFRTKNARNTFVRYIW